jgi:mannitol-1-phosphate/altronate dehydrogenase
MTSLTRETVTRLNAGVSLPRYDRRDVTTAIVDAVTGEFNAFDESVAADLRPGAAPRTMFGLVTEALARRRARGILAFTVLSCDNVQGNGHVSQRAFTAFARLRDPELADWITARVRFPNCMVDRITPKTTDEDRAELSRRFGLDDRWPVLCEPFTQWVLEDDFADGRPPLEDAGVQIVPDVEPYELMKLRLLNASHQALCHPGRLVGYRFVHEVTTDPLFAGFPHELDDDLAPQLQAAARRQRQHLTAFLEDNRTVFGELADDPRFTAVYSSILNSLLERGVRSTFADLDQLAALAQADQVPSAAVERKS